MEQEYVATTIKSFKERLAHTKGGSIYISKEVGKKLLSLSGKETERLKDELLFRRVRVIKSNKLGIENNFNKCYNDNTGG